jgi:hypothetical protein
MEKYFIAKSSSENSFKRHFAHVKDGVITYTGFWFGRDNATMNKRTITDKQLVVSPTGWKEVSEEVFADKVIEAHRYYKFLRKTEEVAS